MRFRLWLKGKDRAVFAKEIGSTKNYVNNLACGAIPGRSLSLIIEEASGGAVTHDELLFPELYDDDGSLINTTLLK